ncbi:MAG: hypothetical protein PHI18_03335, partial [bacterium]|nr:hypothetical protein [bacterium]
MLTVRHLLISLAALAWAIDAGGMPADYASVRTERTVRLDERWPVGQPVRLCALLVEFQEDDVEGTTGTGRMGTGFDSSLVIDPLPHDRQYFADHLSFLRDYYETVSRRNLLFDTTAMTVFPRNEGEFYRLDHPMWHYNYNSDDETLNRKLVELFVESCAKADPDVDFSQFDAVLVFHAGVGKDFNIGYDATPFDIPSAYISQRDLQDYSGVVPIPDDVTRGVILPEGENQLEALDFGVELSLNGILVKLFGNWMGLPDLFDTETGASGIGRWGMMDQGSGNMSALVPGMPDAWSRIFMGWETPLIRVPSGRGDTVRLARFGYESAPQIVKIPITLREYYLLENRDADADSIGYVTLWDRAGKIMRVLADQTIQIEQGFGVPVKASHYDFGIPGSGILIWHVDEDVIEAGLETNTVNINFDHRGVDLVEADGAQDIGYEYGFASAGSGAELGIQEDAWYLNNSQHREANGGATSELFTDHTFPPARLYDGAYTRLRLSNFSPVDSVMSFVCRMEDAAVGYPACIPNALEWTIADLDGDSLRELYVCRYDSLLQISNDGAIRALAALPEGLLPAFPSSVDMDGDGDDELLFEGYDLGILNHDSATISLNTTYAHSSENRVFAARSESGTGRILCIGNDAVQYIWQIFDEDLNLLDRQNLPFLARERISISNLESFPAHRFVISGEALAICYSISDSSLDQVWSISDLRLSGNAMVVVQPDTTAIYLEGYGYVEAATGQALCLAPDCDPPAVDWDGNGVVDGGGWWGRNAIPREDAPQMAATMTWIADLDANGQPDILGLDAPFTPAGETMPRFTRIHAMLHSGGVLADFPVAVFGTEGDIPPFEWSNDGDLYLMYLMQIGDSTYFTPLRLFDAWRT